MFYLKGRGNISIEVFNQDGSLINTFDSIDECALFFGCSSRTIHRRLENNNSFSCASFWILIASPRRAVSGLANRERLARGPGLFGMSLKHLSYPASKYSGDHSMTDNAMRDALDPRSGWELKLV